MRPPATGNSRTAAPLDRLGALLAIVWGRQSSTLFELDGLQSSIAPTPSFPRRNVIRRREETNATRSALNTAKLIDENPTLMRLKEFKALEKVTEKIEKLTVFGGLDGLLNRLVKLKM